MNNYAILKNDLAVEISSSNSLHEIIWFVNL